MLAEVGHFALILALCLAGIQAVLPLAGTYSRRRLWVAAARPLVSGQFVFVAISFVILALLFIGDDFSVSYVAANSNSQLPTHYKLSAVWGAHEGSLLLWSLVLAGWSLAVALCSRSLPVELVARILSVLACISVGFYLLLLLTSNPFERLLPIAPVDGGDLNPLLQDFGLIVHPPMLYMGYVGFSVPFAFAIAALLAGRMDSAWARWARPWTNAAWAFLTLGIALGSWWAYYELGWGGWWFWDPVENASFMPWLTGTALVHSLAVAEKRGLFRSWTLLLAILTFSLSLLGTFLVRSGILTSVHAFAADPTRGAFILIFLAMVVGGSLLLFALRGPVIYRQAAFAPISREAFLLANNVLLVSACGAVFVGTLYPLLADAMNWGKISVGPPYFNLMFVPLALTALLLMAPGSTLRWKQHAGALLQRPFMVLTVAAGVSSIIWLLWLGYEIRLVPVVAVALGLWVFLVSVWDVAQKTSSVRGRWVGIRRLRGSYYGMQLAHVGVAVAVIGVAMTSYYNEQKDLRLAPGESVVVGHYRFEFTGLEQVRGPNYIAHQGSFSISREGAPVALLQPEKRFYSVAGQVMTEAAIDAGLWRDLYVALGERLDDGASWTLRIYIKPFVRWIWLGALLMATGGCVAMLDKRYSKLAVSRNSVQAPSSEKLEVTAPEPRDGAGLPGRG